MEKNTTVGKIAKNEAMRVLEECQEIMIKKANDYQNPNSRIKQADYYPNGVITLLDIIHAKKLRMDSVVAAMQNDPDYKPNFESIEDSAKDMCNYLSFVVSYCRGKMEGQSEDRDIFNRPSSKVNDRQLELNLQ